MRQPAVPPAARRLRARTTRKALAATVAMAAVASVATTESAGPVPDPSRESSSLQTASLATVQLRSGLTSKVTGVLGRAYPLAVEHASGRPACRNLFAALGAEAGEVLRRTLYYPPSEQFSRTCTHSYAVTGMGAAVTMLCPAFASLGVERAAMVLIHEALHQAGLPEAPAPGAATSSQINRTIWKRCF